MAIFLKGGFLLVPLALLLSGCEPPDEASFRGECTGKTEGGGECKFSGEVKWVRSPPKDPDSKKLVAVLQGNGPVPDAALHVIDVSASSIPVPSSGTMTLRLIDSSTRTVIASQSFAWDGVRGRIRARDPNAINEWTYRNLGSADTLQYEISKFHSAYGPGLQRISGSSVYDGAVISSFSSQFHSAPACTTYPSPHQCTRD